MKKLAIFTTLSAALLLSTNLFFGKMNLHSYVYSPDYNYRVFELEYTSGSEYLCVEKINQVKKLFEFKNVKSFSFSKDSAYIFIERSEYNYDLDVRNDYLEVFNLINRKRVLYMPFCKKCYPSIRYYKSKNYNVDDLINLEFIGDTLESVDWNFEDALVQVSANLDNVRSVYVSQFGFSLSVYFNDGSLKIYLPKKDFSGLYAAFEFEALNRVQLLTCSIDEKNDPLFFENFGYFLD